MRIPTLYTALAVTLTLGAACDRGDTETDGAANAAPGEGSAVAEIEGPLGGGTGEAVPVDHADPEAVVATMLEVATTNEWDRLANLCDPNGEGDGDTRRICDLATNPEDRAEFIEVFRGGTVGEFVEVNAETGQARVPFTFGQTERENETMNLVLRDGAWYLYSF